ncbi:MAG TPA: DUF305 domain-containing protein [Terriglobales bacterium]|nr:DUF305 domain-containing protein [Terriglobales bacterium]
MSKHHPDELAAPQPDDPIFAAFGIDPAEAEMAQAATRPRRRLLRKAVIAGLAVIALAVGSLFLRPAHMLAHADAASTPAAAPAQHSFKDDMTQAMMNMHMAMNQPYSGDPDRDFASMMIPHHQGAIDMAQLELRYGKDPRLRRLAEEIIVTQQQEISVMQLVLKDLAAGQQPGSPPSAAAPVAGSMGGMEMNGMPMQEAAPQSSAPATGTTP